MPSRRPHTKTRHGCSTCKTRRVRCDEEKPICRNCTRGNRVCSYSQVLTLPSSLASTSSDCQESIFPMRDLELLHQWTAFTSVTMSHDDISNLELWRDHVPRMAFSNRFLLHGILALAALHIRYQSPQQEKESLMSVARYHQQHALTLYIPMLQQITQQNCDALFAFSLLLGALCFAMFHDDPEDPQSVVAQLLDVFDAFFGCTAIAIGGREWLFSGRLRPVLLALQPEEQDFTNLDPDVKSALESLRRIVETALAGHTDEDSIMRRKAYHKGIWALAAVMATTPGKRQISIVCSWPVMVESDFISLLKRRDPMALLILGYYGVALHLLGRVWSLDGLGRKVSEAIYHELDVRWQPSMTWALNKIAEPISEQATPSPWGVSPHFPVVYQESAQLPML